MSANPAREFINRIHRDVAEAKAAGADEDDCCIVMPISYMAVIYCWPVIELGARRICVTTMREALGLVTSLEFESGWGPPVTRPSGGGGLWGFTQ